MAGNDYPEDLMWSEENVLIPKVDSSINIKTAQKCKIKIEELVADCTIVGDENTILVRKSKGGCLQIIGRLNQIKIEEGFCVTYSTNETNKIEGGRSICEYNGEEIAEVEKDISTLISRIKLIQRFEEIVKNPPAQPIVPEGVTKQKLRPPRPLPEMPTDIFLNDSQGSQLQLNPRYFLDDSPFKNKKGDTINVVRMPGTQDPKVEECVICCQACDKMEDNCGILECLHYFHFECIKKYLETAPNCWCPTCRHGVTAVGLTCP